MNITNSTPKHNISVEATQLLAILRDCGIDQVWNDPETHLLSFYLRNTPQAARGMQSEIGRSSYRFCVNQMTSAWKYSLTCPEVDIKNWFLTYADSSHLSQALRTSAQENLNTPALTVTYDKHHTGVAKDHADFEKVVTLFLLENFPTKFPYDQEILINRLNYYEYFRQQHGDIPVLKSFRGSIMRKEAGNLARLKEHPLTNGKPLKPKTACTSKYISMTSYDRLRFMRYYRFTVSSSKS